MLRRWRRPLLLFSEWWQLEALYRSHTEAASLARVGLASGIAGGFVSAPSMRTLGAGGRGHSKGGQRPATTEGLPSLAALGLAGGDGTEPADLLAGLSDQVRVRTASPTPPPHRTDDPGDPAVPPGAPPLTFLPGPFG
ncbi:hypothetical protein ACF1G5_02250 [Streptomyces coeruleorubidus]|uniref:hypothetical protein n=1 Tax=Streptomyces coeruleorubidus TaxID=116188 RepID=UPI0036F8F3C9